MSQKKVDAYKEYKKNKEQILKREKRMRNLEYGIIIAVCCVFVGWFGVSAYQSATKKPASTEPAEAVVVDMNGYSDYVQGLSQSFSD